MVKNNIFESIENNEIVKEISKTSKNLFKDFFGLIQGKKLREGAENITPNSAGPITISVPNGPSYTFGQRLNNADLYSSFPSGYFKFIFTLDSEADKHFTIYINIKTNDSNMYISFKRGDNPRLEEAWANKSDSSSPDYKLYRDIISFRQYNGSIYAYMWDVPADIAPALAATRTADQKDGIYNELAIIFAENSQYQYLVTSSTSAEYNAHTTQFTLSPNVYNYGNNNTDSNSLLFGGEQTPLSYLTPINSSKGHYITSFFTKEFGDYQNTTTNSGFIDMNNQNNTSSQRVISINKNKISQIKQNNNYLKNMSDIDIVDLMVLTNDTIEGKLDQFFNSDSTCNKYGQLLDNLVSDYYYFLTCKPHMFDQTPAVGHIAPMVGEAVTQYLTDNPDAPANTGTCAILPGITLEVLVEKISARPMSTLFLSKDGGFYVFLYDWEKDGSQYTDIKDLQTSVNEGSRNPYLPIYNDVQGGQHTTDYTDSHTVRVWGGSITVKNQPPFTYAPVKVPNRSISQDTLFNYVKQGTCWPVTISPRGPDNVRFSITDGAVAIEDFFKILCPTEFLGCVPDGGPDKARSSGHTNDKPKTYPLGEVYNDANDVYTMAIAHDKCKAEATNKKLDFFCLQYDNECWLPTTKEDTYQAIFETVLNGETREILPLRSETEIKDTYRSKYNCQQSEITPTVYSGGPWTNACYNVNYNPNCGKYDSQLILDKTGFYISKHNKDTDHTDISYIYNLSSNNIDHDTDLQVNPDWDNTNARYPTGVMSAGQYISLGGGSECIVNTAKTMRVSLDLFGCFRLEMHFNPLSSKFGIIITKIMQQYCSTEPSNFWSGYDFGVNGDKINGSKFNPAYLTKLYKIKVKTDAQSTQTDELLNQNVYLKFKATNNINSGLSDTSYPLDKDFYYKINNTNADKNKHCYSFLHNEKALLFNYNDYSSTNQSGNYTAIGPYKDTGDRALRYGPQNYGYNADTCNAACIKAGNDDGKNYKYFALQNGGWCSCDYDEAHVKMYGKMSDSDCTLRGADGPQLGGGYCNYVYENNSSGEKEIFNKYFKNKINDFSLNDASANSIKNGDIDKCLSACATNQHCSFAVMQNEECKLYKKEIYPEILNRDTAGLNINSGQSIYKKVCGPNDSPIDPILQHAGFATNLIKSTGFNENHPLEIISNSNTSLNITGEIKNTLDPSTIEITDSTIILNNLAKNNYCRNNYNNINITDDSHFYEKCKTLYGNPTVPLAKINDPDSSISNFFNNCCSELVDLERVIKINQSAQQTTNTNDTTQSIQANVANINQNSATSILEQAGFANINNIPSNEFFEKVNNDTININNILTDLNKELILSKEKNNINYDNTNYDKNNDLNILNIDTNTILLLILFICLIIIMINLIKKK